MASLILHGDLNSKQPASTRPLYVRPILRQDPRDWRNNSETVPDGVLLVDLMHRAVRRLFEGEGKVDAVAPNITLINLSIGILDRPFNQFLSPLARLLDWLAWRYRILFVVSSGNYTHSIQLEDGAPIEEQYLIRSIAADSRHRRILSPGESVNSLTVAALHDDQSSCTNPSGWQNPFTTSGLPSLINAQGPGFRRAIKPDLLAPGGQVLVQKAWKMETKSTVLDVFTQYGGPGQLVASPGTIPGRLDYTWYTRGTSNATAIVSRTCIEIYELLDDLTKEPLGELIDKIPRAVWLKALVTHGAEWGTSEEVLANILKNESNSQRFRDYVTRLLGYGVLNVDKVRECTPFRVTVLSAGAVGQDKSQIHKVPLPPSLSDISGQRRLTITLAWLTPVNPRHQGWRRADLWFTPQVRCENWNAPKPIGKVRDEVRSNTRFLKAIRRQSSLTVLISKFR